MNSLGFFLKVMHKSFVICFIPHIWSKHVSQLVSSSLVISFHRCIFFFLPTMAEVQCIWQMGYVMLLLLNHFKKGMHNIFIFIICFTVYLFTYGTCVPSTFYIHIYDIHN